LSIAHIKQELEFQSVILFIMFEKTSKPKNDS